VGKKCKDNPEDLQTLHPGIIPFSREIFIERDDFMEAGHPKKYFRLAPGNMVRLKVHTFIKCDEVIKDE